ncbi:hypothetical protein HMPREF0491_01572 [Lachnospiraceae oral taxon 107 str. F0167]|nr:hypothetical protein HMPREF0491_01572 [Lachnospiraceae oral taxon 107 str. F0167]
MEIFILEDQMEKVVNPKTKEYLEEVVSCYRNGNYRASVVVLYTTLIFDLMQKLITLKDVYDEEKAKVIYNEIKQKQKNNPFDPSWETYLIDKICEDMKIISKVEKEELEHLKKERNYAAHPIISESEELTLKPIRKETAGDLIRKAFEIVFLRDAILARDINIKIVEDLKEYYLRVAESGFEKYIYTRYLNRMTQARKNELFKFLWQSVFIWEDDDAIRNRDSNLLGLIYMYNGDHKGYKKIIKDNEDKLLNKIQVETFSSWYISLIYNKSNLTYNDFIEAYEKFKRSSRIISLIKFIEFNPDIYDCFNEYCINTVRSSVQHMYKGWKKNGFLDIEQFLLESTAVFLKDDVEMHFKEISNKKIKCETYTDGTIHCYRLGEENLKLILNQIEHRNQIDVFKRFLIDYCCSVRSFAEAELRFYHIEICKEYYNEQDYYYILKKMNCNSQIYDNAYCFAENDSGTGDWIKKLDDNFKDKFGKDLVGSNETEKLYDNIYREQYFLLDKDKMLEVIEERALVYTKDELLNILNKRIGSEENNSLTLLDYKTSSQKKYKNIDNILNNC